MEEIDLALMGNNNQTSGSGGQVVGGDSSKSPVLPGTPTESLKLKLKQLKKKKKKKKRNNKHSDDSSSSSSSGEEETSSSSDEDVLLTDKKKKKRGAKKAYNSLSFDYERLHSNNSFLSIPVGKPPRFDGTHYTKWRHNMKMHLISLNPGVWKIVCSGVDLPEDDDEELTYEQQQDIHRNAQATTVLLSSLEREEFDRVDGLEKAKDIWDTLRVAHEGTKPVRKAKIEMLEGQLDRFVMEDDETPQEMFNRLKILVNKVRAYGSKRWNDRKVVKRILRAYAVRDMTLCSLIRENPEYKRMTPNDVLGRIINHQMFQEEANYVKNLSKGVASSKKQNIALKASKKSKSKQVVEESSSDEEENESSEVDAEDMALFIKRFKKFMKKEHNHKGDKKDKTRTRTKRMCYNCGKYGHFIANCPYEKKDDEEGKKKKERRFSKDKKTFKKKYSGEAHIGQEWDSNEESSDSDNEGVATIAIESSSSSKSLFPNLNKGKVVNHKCLMAKESKRKVKTKSSHSPKYVSSDEELASDDDDEAWLKGLSKNAIMKINGLMEDLVARDELLEKQEDLLILEKKRNLELEKLLKLEKEKNEKVDLKLARSKETITSLESSSVALQEAYDVLQKTHKNLEVQFDTLWSSTSSYSSTLKATKASTSDGCERCYNIVDTNACASYEKTIGALKSKVSSLEAQVQEKKKSNDDAKAEYARGAYLNTRRPNVKSGIGYIDGAKHNARVNNNGKEFVKFTKEGSYQKKQEKSKASNNSSYAHNYYANASHTSHMSYHEFDASYVLMKNKFGRIVAKYVGPRHKRSKTCVWVPKSLVTNVRGPNQVWVPKNKA